MCCSEESWYSRVCCSELQCVAVCCSVLQRVAVCCSVLQWVAVCCSVLQCVAVCRSVLQCVAVCCSALQCVAVCCSVLQCAAVCCSVDSHYSDTTLRLLHRVLQYVAVRCSVLQCVAAALRHHLFIVAQRLCNMRGKHTVKDVLGRFFLCLAEMSPPLLQLKQRGHILLITINSQKISAEVICCGKTSVELTFQNG